MLFGHLERRHLTVESLYTVLKDGKSTEVRENHELVSRIHFCSNQAVVRFHLNMDKSHYYVYEDFADAQSANLKVGRPLKMGGPAATQIQKTILETCLTINKKVVPLQRQIAKIRSLALVNKS